MPPRWQALVYGTPNRARALGAVRRSPRRNRAWRAWAGNTIQMADGSCVLIDWELAGQGFARDGLRPAAPVLPRGGRSAIGCLVAPDG